MPKTMDPGWWWVLVPLGAWLAVQLIYGALIAWDTWLLRRIHRRYTTRRPPRYLFRHYRKVT
jgi:hypothetical protein